MKDTKKNKKLTDFDLKQIDKLCDNIQRDKTPQGKPPKEIITDWYIEKLLL